MLYMVRLGVRAGINTIKHMDGNVLSLTACVTKGHHYNIILSEE